MSLLTRLGATAAVTALALMVPQAAYAATETEILSGPTAGWTEANPNILPGDVAFTFTTNEGGSTYECQLNDTGAWVACSGGNSMSYSNLPPGSYIFRVRGTVLGQTDPTPAERFFNIRNVPCEQAGQDYKVAQAQFFRYHTKKGHKKEALQRAKAAGNDQKVKRLKKKIKALNKQIKKWDKAMKAAIAQEHAVC